MKNIASNEGKIEQSRRIFSLHVRYLTFLSLLLILLFGAVFLFLREREIGGSAGTRLEQAYTGLLRTSFSDASAALREAGTADEADYAEKIRIAEDRVEQMIGGCTLYGPTDSRQLTPYLDQLADLCAALSRRAAAGHVPDSDRALCLRLADQIGRISGDGGRLLAPESGRQLDLRISPYLGGGMDL